MAPGFDTLAEHDLHEEVEEEIDFSGECEVWSRYAALRANHWPGLQISRRSMR